MPPRRRVACALLCAAVARGATEPPAWLIPPDTAVYLGPAATPAFAQSAAFGAAPLATAGHYTLYLAADPATGALIYGCGATGGPPLPPLPRSPAGPAAVAIPRGVCGFANKAAAAAAAGAAALLVFDAAEGAYLAHANVSSTALLNASALAVDGCAYDCGAGSGTVSLAAATNVTAAAGGYPGSCGTGCGTGVCLLTGERVWAPSGVEARGVCCAVDTLVPMAAGPAANATALAGVTAAFLPVSAVAGLLAAFAAAAPSPVAASLALRPTPVIDPSGVAMVVLGTAVAAAASFYGARLERDAIRRIARGEPPADDAATRAGGGLGASPHSPPADLSLGAALSLLVFACVVLGGLYGLIRAGVSVVALILALFFVGASSAVAVVLVRPLLTAALPPAWDKASVTLGIPRTRWRLAVSSSALAAGAVGVAAAGVYTGLRHQTWSWALQDVMGAALCASFLATLRVTSLRTAAVTLCAFLAYDVFMVFLTPFIFGTSVMVDVATAGGAPAAYTAGDQACYCRAHPTDATYCAPTEYLPILLRLPRSSDYRGGYAMLGLGDVVLPGLLLALALRQDYYSRRAGVPGLGGGWTRGDHGLPDAPAPMHGSAQGRWAAGVLADARAAAGCARGVGYWPTAVAGYAVGLAVANAAVALMAMGQPALLYLVPCTVGPVVALAWSRGELRTWWHPDAAAGQAEAAFGRHTPVVEGAARRGGEGGAGGGGGGGEQLLAGGGAGGADEAGVAEEGGAVGAAREALGYTYAVREPKPDGG